MTVVREWVRIAAGAALRWRARASARKAGVVLVYHRVGGVGRDPELEIDPAVPADAFAQHLRHLRRHYRVVPAGTILEVTGARRRGQRLPVAVTFDDDLPSHVREALPALRRAGCHATFFLSGGPARPHWWDDLQRAVDGRLVQADGLPHLPERDVRAALERSPRAIRGLASAVERLTPSQRAEVAAALREAVGPPSADSVMAADDVRRLAEAGLGIGFHTLRHDPLPSLPDHELDGALREGRAELAAAARASIDLVAYPHGKADDRVAAAAREARFAAAFTTSPGVASPATDPYRVPRVVPASSAGAFALQLGRVLSGRR
jgi:peptidoglycan/xylan/chitin deacetylase (PgdA/CDA1 family)